MKIKLKFFLVAYRELDRVCKKTKFVYDIPAGKFEVTTFLN